jgi:glycosyltransferase involved in cell wall biosynthesis
MRILIVAHGYPPAFTGGAELRAERTARGLVAAGHDVAVLSAESFPGAESGPAILEHSQDGVLVHHMQLRYDAEGDLHRQEYHHPDVATELEAMIERWRPDVIHLFSGYLTGLAVIHTAKTASVPVVVSLTDYWWLCHRIIMVRTNGLRCEGPTPGGCARCHWEVYRRFRIPSQVARPLLDRFWDAAEKSAPLAGTLGMDKQAERRRALTEALSMADALIAPSNVLANVYVNHGIRPDHVHVLRQGVDLDACPVRVPAEAVRFGYFGQIKRHKGVHTLIEAWQKLAGERPRELILRGSFRGEEHYAEELRTLSATMEDITWAPLIPHNEIWEALARIDVLVVPSRWLENSPNIILEAQAMGVVVIGTALGGIAELVQHGHNGLLFEADDAASLCAQMQRMIDEPELIAQLRRNALPFGSFPAEIDQIVQLYHSCLQRDTAPTAIAAAPPAGRTATLANGLEKASMASGDVIDLTELSDFTGHTDHPGHAGYSGMVD